MTGNIYGPSSFQTKQSFLGFLQWIQGLAGQEPWVLGGDFNLIANLEEKKGGQRALDNFQEAFRECLARGPLVDVETGNGWFTWNNKRGGEHLVASRLDRFLVAENIMHSTGDFMAAVLPANGSDHWPISLHWDGTGSPRGKPFRFESFWMEHKDFKDLVGQWWQEFVPPPGTIMYRFQQN